MKNHFIKHLSTNQRQWLWFVGLWLFGFLSVGILSLAIKWLMGV